jgi:hypothetical protein
MDEILFHLILLVNNVNPRLSKRGAEPSFAGGDFSTPTKSKSPRIRNRRLCLLTSCTWLVLTGGRCRVAALPYGDACGNVSCGGGSCDDVRLIGLPVYRALCHDLYSALRRLRRLKQTVTAAP